MSFNSLKSTSSEEYYGAFLESYYNILESVGWNKIMLVFKSVSGTSGFLFISLKICVKVCGPLHFECVFLLFIVPV